MLSVYWVDFSLKCIRKLWDMLAEKISAAAEETQIQ